MNFEQNGTCDQKNVITQILQSLNNFISILDEHFPEMCSVIEQLNQNKSIVCQEVRNMANSTLSKLLRDSLYNYARENLALVNIYIKQPGRHS